MIWVLVLDCTRNYADFFSITRNGFDYAIPVTAALSRIRLGIGP